ncbi:hypothetical protein L6452_17908 [Arctium lappa]|uniref:Uncharacterized protein n=1 Tax=Arctium lappa TaxID=4217 RepID=A0ACB9C4W6_ARCLA|nr:hypothetical protein L6452_17908 [Arctium lappa]
MDLETFMRHPERGKCVTYNELGPSPVKKLVWKYTGSRQPTVLAGALCIICTSKVARERRTVDVSGWRLRSPSLLSGSLPLSVSRSSASGQDFKVQSAKGTIQRLRILYQR